MFSNDKKSNTQKVRDANLVKSPRVYSKKQITSSQASFKRVSEKESQLKRKDIFQEKLFSDETSPESSPCKMSQHLTSKSVKPLLGNESAIPENGFSKIGGAETGDPSGFYGEDWDEMEFLESSNCNTLNGSIQTNEALNGKYARTRKNLGEKMSANVGGNELFKKSTMQSSKTIVSLSSPNLNPSYSKQLAKQSPMKKTLQSSTSLNKTVLSKDCKPTLLDMVKKLSANIAASDNTICKTALPKPSSSMLKYLNKIRSEPPRANSVTDVSYRSLVPNSIEISLVPEASKSPLKNINPPSIKDRELKEGALKRKLPDMSKSLLLKDKASAIKTKRSIEKSSELVENVTKKSRSLKKEKTNLINETVHDPPICNSRVTHIETGRISDKEISSWIDEEIIKGTDDLKKSFSNGNSESQVMTSDSAPQIMTSASQVITSNANTINPTYIFTPSLPNSLNHTFVQPNVNNNVIYDVNSLSLYPPVPTPVSTTVFILPVSSNFSTEPNSRGYMNSFPPSQPIIKVSCNGMNSDAVFKSLCKTFYQSPVASTQSTENGIHPEASNEIIQTNSLVQTSVSASSSTFIQPTKAFPNLSEPREGSSSESEVKAVSTNDRSCLVLSYFCELMKNRCKLPLEQYKKEANEVLDVLSSFPHYLSVNYFCSNTEEFFSDLCFCDSSSQSTAFKFEENFQELHLNEVLKKYVSFQVNEIAKALPTEPFYVKSNLIFKASNSKLTYFEKLILKKMLKSNQSIDLEELISRLFFVGLVVIFNELKRQNKL